MDNRLPIYDICIDDDSLGLTAISIVDDPAIQENFIAFKDEKLVESNLWLSSHEKREIVSPVLIPNQLILRRSEDGQLYYIRWSEKTIRQSAERYLANGWFNNVTVNHPTFYDENLTYEDVLEKDVYMLRMWIIEDEKTDDANTKYGFSLPKGTLMVHFKIHNRKIWKRIKDGELKGLSIEAFTSMVKSDNDINLNISMNKLDVNDKQMGLFQKFVQFLNSVSDEALAAAENAKTDETESGEVKLTYQVDEEKFITVDEEGFARDMEYKILAEGEYQLYDGNMFYVDGEGKFAGTKSIDDAEKLVKENDKETLVPIAEKKEDLEDEEKTDTDGGECVTDDGQADTDTDKETADTHEEDTADEPKDKEDEDREVRDENIEAPLSLIPFKIDGVEYLLPTEVVDFINKLQGKADEVFAELNLMKERIPSVEPINTTAGVKEEGNDLHNAIRLLNWKN